MRLLGTITAAFGVAVALLGALVAGSIGPGPSAWCAIAPAPDGAGAGVAREHLLGYSCAWLLEDGSTVVRGPNGADLGLVIIGALLLLVGLTLLLLARRRARRAAAG